MPAARWYAHLCVRAYKLAARARVDRGAGWMFVYVCTCAFVRGERWLGHGQGDALFPWEKERRPSPPLCAMLEAASRCWATRLTDANEPLDIGCVLYIAIGSRRENSIRTRGINLRRETEMPSCNRVRIRTIDRLHAIKQKKHVQSNEFLRRNEILITSYIYTYKATLPTLFVNYL